MSIELTMPALSPTMEKGTLAAWLVAEGDVVEAGDVIAEIETDKATMEFEAPDGGRIAKLLLAAGSEDVPVGTPLALLASLDESIAEQADTSVATAAAEFADAVPVASETVTLIADAQRRRPSPPDVRPSPSDVSATPLARRLAAMLGIDIALVNGSGANGRVRKSDLGLYSVPAHRAKTSSDLIVIKEPASAVAEIPHSTERLGSMRRTIARRLTESKTSVPHFYLTVRCNIDPLLELRSRLNATLAAEGGKLSVNDLLLKAMAKAMSDVPEVNVQFGGDELIQFERVDISLAVAVDGGLVTPVLKDVASLSLSAISAEARSLAEQARNGRLLPEDYQGGTASLSNLGMFGTETIFPVLNPPQALIVGVGAGIEQPWKVDGEIKLASVMAITGSFDHRVIDGVTGATFLQRLQQIVEAPILLTV